MARKPDLLIINKKKNQRTCQIEAFVVLAYNRVKLKENEKRDKYLDIDRELKKKLWNMKVTVIQIITGALATLTKGLMMYLEDLEIQRWVETIQTTAWVRWVRILRNVLES